MTRSNIASKGSWQCVTSSIACYSWISYSWIKPTECVDAIFFTLGDLYSDRYCGEEHGDDDRCDGLEHGQQDRDDGAKSDRKNGGSNIGRSKDRDQDTNPLSNKEKYQDVTSRWSDPPSSSSAGYIHDRRERCRQLAGSGGWNNAWSHHRAKRVNSQDESNTIVDNSTNAKNLLLLPRIGDVVAVNSLRLLEGAAAIRLHHHQ